MRKIILFIGLLGILNNSKAQSKSFTLNGKITDTSYHHGKVVLMYKDTNNQYRIDTAITKNGQFIFYGMIPTVSRIQLTVHAISNIVNSPRNRQIEIIFPLENCDAQLFVTKYDDFTVSGSKCFNDQLMFNDIYKPLVKQFKGSELILKQNILIDSFINAKPSSYLSLLLLSEKIAKAKQLGDLDNWFNKLPFNYQNSTIGLNMQKKLIKLKEIAPGQPAPSFNLPDLNGNTVKLSDYKGKFLFLHFWASWCSPCRQENINLINAYQNKKNENLSFLGISVDDSKIKLENAILKDKINWNQLVTFKGFNQPVMEEFGIKGVPRNFLIGPDGKIVAMDLRGPDLLEKLRVLTQ
jgi:peroxiredoxin